MESRTTFGSDAEKKSRPAIEKVRMQRFGKVRKDVCKCFWSFRRVPHPDIEALRPPSELPVF